MTEWRLDAGGQTLVLASAGGIPAVVYWGATLPDDDLGQLVLAAQNDLTGGMIDALPTLSLCPESGRAFQGQPGMVIHAADGTPLHPAFRFSHAEETPGRLVLHSTSDGLTLSHILTAQPTGVITLQTRLNSATPIRVQWLAAPVLPAPQAAGELIDVSGKWTREFQLNRVPWTPGIHLREARTGRSGHEHPPWLILPETGCTNTQGTAFALHYAWSGGHRMLAEELPDGRRQVQFGHATGAETEPGTRFETAELIAAHSTRGLNGIAVTFQRDIRDRVVTWPTPARPRPVHYNCWEAVYFNHTLEGLTAIATRAAALGAERFVLDDGWFGRRNDDTSSLGDWTVDKRKWPQGLHPLIAHVHALGMTFGLWFEPEMANPDSDLLRAHAGWLLGPADQVTGRHQMVLNLALPAVQDNLFRQVSAVLTEYPIDYVKWDHNRLLPVVDAAQTRGAYALFDRLRAAHPDVEIESCASGGGRIDAGILARTQRVWLSDSNDALERLAIQHNAALFLPAAVTGSHVGPRHCHTSGRILPMAFRATAAAQRHMGFEMDLRELTEAEAATLTDVTAWWKANRAWTMRADIHRLDAADPATIAELQLAEDGSRFIAFIGQRDTSPQILPRPLRLTGLDPDARYHITLRNPEDAPPQSRGQNALKSGPLTLSGQYLMTHGLTLPVAWPATIWVVEGSRL
ncbi:alpha-galactosidase [Rhodobacter ferrooxidans]|uniref:Alpha-galactosidase n=1 Tax=Rhodobacter ferrooxidans TaxID=371731 RepID=C8RWU2_9RHOB|nr:alpha-galactosidase [Rhodobacter sp. SW2]EEW27035.1 glycoside hydrolase clan GH-D [Rhodobacter sp. SW2]